MKVRVSSVWKLSGQSTEVDVYEHAFNPKNVNMINYHAGEAVQLHLDSVKAQHHASRDVHITDVSFVVTFEH